MQRPYHLDWVTEHIAVGGAPISHDQLDAIRLQGVDAIVNLCAEYCDLHDIETSHGFSVFYLPIADEGVPDTETLDQAMAWMDTLINQNKRVLIHCRLGIGRTGTFLYAYINSRNLFARIGKDTLAQLRSRPANYHQWSLASGYAPGMETRRPWPNCIAPLVRWLKVIAGWLPGRGGR